MEGVLAFEIDLWCLCELGICQTCMEHVKQSEERSEGPLNELWLLTWLTLTSSEPAYISIDRHNTALNDPLGSFSFFSLSLCN